MVTTGFRDFIFEHLEHLAPIMARMAPSGLILGVWAAWSQIWPEWVFEHLDRLAPVVARMGPKGLILSIWATWPKILPEGVSRAMLYTADLSVLS